MTLSYSPAYTTEQIVKAAERVVEELGPDYVYATKRRQNPQVSSQQCFYAEPDGTPSCIVGRIIDKLNHSAFEELKLLEGGMWSPPALEALFELNTEFTTEQMYALSAAQRVQDWGEPYGRALDALKEELGTV